MTIQPDSNQRTIVSPRFHFWAIGFALVYPTLLTLMYFQWLQGAAVGLQQAVYGFGKLLQFTFPVVVVWSQGRSRREVSVSGRSELGEVSLGALGRGRFAAFSDTMQTNLILGVLFGTGVVLAMLAIFFFILPSDVRQSLEVAVKAKVSSMGLNSPSRFLALSTFYVVGHSFLEEYYWRWFVFSELRRSMATWLANLVAAIGFMAHHVVLLGFFFGWASPLTYLVSVSVAVGGLFWAWMFNRRFGFRCAWLSHAIVDAGIFGLGMLILRS